MQPGGKSRESSHCRGVILKKTLHGGKKGERMSGVEKEWVEKLWIWIISIFFSHDLFFSSSNSLVGKSWKEKKGLRRERKN
jgi:hypothetical protein